MDSGCSEGSRAPFTGEALLGYHGVGVVDVFLILASDSGGLSDN